MCRCICWTSWACALTKRQCALLVDPILTVLQASNLNGHGLNGRGLNERGPAGHAPTRRRPPHQRGSAPNRKHHPKARPTARRGAMQRAPDRKPRRPNAPNGPGRAQRRRVGQPGRPAEPPAANAPAPPHVPSGRTDGSGRKVRGMTGPRARSAPNGLSARSVPKGLCALSAPNGPCGTSGLRGHPGLQGPAGPKRRFGGHGPCSRRELASRGGPAFWGAPLRLRTLTASRNADGATTRRRGLCALLLHHGKLPPRQWSRSGLPGCWRAPAWHRGATSRR